jgi:colicin import membrane protein
LDEDRHYWALAASSALHGTMLILILLGFASAPRFEDNTESIPVETVSLSELNQVMNGEKDAQPSREPPPRSDPAPASPQPPQPPPDLRTAEEPAPPPRPEPPAAPKQEAPPPKPAPAPKPLADAPEPPARPKEPQPEKPRPDPVAKAIEKPDPPPKPARVYDPNAIAKLIGQPKPQAAATNGAGSAVPLGLPHHDAPRMSVSMASALDAWLTESYLNCWTPPPAMPEGDVYVAQVKVVLNPDGSLSGRPVLLNPPTDPAWRAHADSAMRAVRKCDPLHVPPQYAPFFEEWKIETIHFDPRDTQG